MRTEMRIAIFYGDHFCCELVPDSVNCASTCFVTWDMTWHRRRKKYLIYMKGRSVRWWWDEKVENFPLEVALDKWPSKTYAMCILQGLREISAEKLEWDYKKGRKFVQSSDSVITIVTNWYYSWLPGHIRGMNNVHKNTGAGADPGQGETGEHGTGWWWLSDPDTEHF